MLTLKEPILGESLSAPVLDSSRIDHVETSCGASARKVEREGREQLEVYDSQDQLMFRFDPLTGGATLNVPKGNLSLNCEQGDIELNAAGAVRTSCRDFDVLATKRVSIALVEGVKKCLSRLLFRGGSIETKSSDVCIRAKNTKIESQETSIRGHRYDVKSDAIKMKSTRQAIETDVLEESSIRRMQKTESVSEIKAGRVRTIVSGLLQYRAKKAMMSAEGDYKINGEKIHLG